jgi:hypothetical protein
MVTGEESEREKRGGERHFSNNHNAKFLLMRNYYSHILTALMNKI